MVYIKLTIKAAPKLTLMNLVVACAFLSVENCYSIDPVYHDLDEIYDELVALSEEYPDWVSLDSVGHSSNYNLPIWMIKISDNPQIAENEPALLFIGQVHSEEVIGVELTLYLMRYLLENLEEEGFAERLQDLELYFIPTANPEGLRVVHSGEDDAFRKNCRDNIGDGELRIQDGVGWDTSGVDINRNFGLHWDRGDSLFTAGDESVYNYYRGSAPFSESESQMLRDLALQKRFVYSISYHSSRSGQNEELVIAPWYWDGRGTPDRLAIDALLDTLAGQMPIQIDDNAFYTTAHSTQRLGQSLEWFYQAAGAFQYIVEIGEEIQPDSVVLAGLIQDQLESALYLMDLACGRQVLDGFGQLGIHIIDAVSWEPLRAKIVNEQLTSPLLEPRRAASETGRFDWLLPVGNYDFIISMPAYITQRADDIQIASGELNQLSIELYPIPRREVNFIVHNATDNQPLEVWITLYTNSELMGRWFVPHDGLLLNLAETFYRVEIIEDAFLPFIAEMEFSPDNDDILINLAPAEITYDEQFEMMGNWQHGGDGDDWGVIEFDNRVVVTESSTGAYPDNAAPWMLIQTGAEIRDQYLSMIRLIHRPYFEPGADSGMVNIWNRNNNTWQTLAAYSQFPSGWDTTYLSCAGLPEGSLAVRFMVSTDGRVTEDGWLIDRLTIYRSTIIQNDPINPVIPATFSVALYPNPTNGLSMLQLNLIQSADYQYGIYDALGRIVERKIVGMLPAGKHRFVIHTGSLTSGLYYLNISSPNSSQIMKLTLLK